jgi:hypothetical protein
MATGPNTIMDIDKDKAIAIISDIIHDHIKGKHKDKISKDLAAKIYDSLIGDTPTWYIHG